jgi:hypothetical protein
MPILLIMQIGIPPYLPCPLGFSSYPLFGLCNLHPLPCAPLYQPWSGHVTPVDSFSIDYLYERRAYVETRDPFRSLGTLREVECGAQILGGSIPRPFCCMKNQKYFLYSFGILFYFILFYSILLFFLFFIFSTYSSCSVNWVMMC